MKLVTAQRMLTVTLVAYVVCDILLTPPAHLETRDPARVTGLGIAALGLLFVGLALSIVALVLLFRRPGRSPIVAVIAAVLYFPAFFSELTGHFSSLQAPSAIVWVESVQAVVAVAAILISISLIRRSNKPT
jgi:hypothetical protein